MIRFALRQFRAQGAVALGALVVLGIVLLITGPHLVDLYRSLVAPCAKNNDCQLATQTFEKTDNVLYHVLSIVMEVIPGLIGLFWGAPLVAREFEAGTHRLAWTQSVPRSHWLAIKLGVMGLASMVTAGLFSLLVTWWSSPLDRVSGTPFSTFDQRDLVPVGYAAFAFVLGVLVGIVLRKTLPAMATTLVLFVFSRLAVMYWIRPHLISPKHMSVALSIQNVGFNITNGGPVNIVGNAPNTPLFGSAWIYSSNVVNRLGAAPAPGVMARACPDIGQPLNAPAAAVGRRLKNGFAVKAPQEIQTQFQNCINHLSATYHVLVTYQPESRYWSFQWLELGVFLALAVVAGILSLWQVKRRYS